MKRLFLLSLLVFSMFDSHAQKQGKERLDSLLSALPNAVADTQKVFLMAQISFSYSRINPDSGIIYGIMAYDLAKKINWEKGIGNSLYFRGSNYLNQAKLPEALEDYLAALKYFEKVDDKNKLAGVLSNIGGVYGYQKKNEKALEYFQKALTINRKYFPRSNFEAANLGNIGIIYFDQKDYLKSLDYNLQALSILKELGNVEMMTTSLISLAGIYIELKDNAKALGYVNQAKDLSMEIGDDNVLAGCYTYKGIAITHIVTQNNQHLIDSLFQGKKEIALQEAKANLDSALMKLQVVGDQLQLSSVYEALSELEEFRGNYVQALNYHKEYKSMDDSIFTADNNDKIMQSAMQYEFEKKEAATKAEQDKKNAIQKNIRNSIGAGFLGTLIFLVVVYRQRNKISKEKARSEELLLNILPEEVADELKAKGSAEAKMIDEVTVLFTDFKGFTQLTEKLPPKELVAEIDTCFRAFDNIMQKHGVEKIKTIGDSYMAAGGLPIPNKTHAADVIKAALEIQQYMHDHKNEREAVGKVFFEIRIGVHTGPVVAGIVGVKKFAYDIWGDTVNIASRMESSGEAGKVNISGTTYELIKDQFNCVHRGKIEAKNKGELNMYFVNNPATES